MEVDGSCHCGYVKFECKVDPAKVSICHCTDCQTISGSAFRVNVAAWSEDLKIIAGTPAVYVKHTAESGRPRQNVFCPKCGTALYAAPHDEVGPHVVALRVGALTQRMSLPPRFQNWTRSAQRWIRDMLPFPPNDRT